MSLPKDRYYIRRQTHPGKNRGRWCVHRPDGIRICPCGTKALAVHICAAFELARLHPTQGGLIGNEKNFEAGLEHSNGVTAVLVVSNRTYVGYEPKRTAGKS